MKFTKKFKENAALGVLGVVLFWGLTNYDKFFRLLGVMIGVLKPVIFGCIIAFILNVPMSGIEKRLFKKPKKEKYVFNACNGEAVKNCDFLKEAAHYYGINFPVIFNGNKNLFDPENLVGNKNNAEKQLDWQANQQWIDIVHDYIDWFKNN